MSTGTYFPAIIRIIRLEICCDEANGEVEREGRNKLDDDGEENETKMKTKERKLELGERKVCI